MLACIASEWPSAVGIERLLEMFWPQGPGTGEPPAYLAMMKAACSLRHPEESLCLCESCRRSLQRELAVEPTWRSSANTSWLDEDAVRVEKSGIPWDTGT